MTFTNTCIKSIETDWKNKYLPGMGSEERQRGMEEERPREGYTGNDTSHHVP